MRMDFNKIAFKFYDTDNDLKLSILDLIQIHTAFDDTSPIGKEMVTLMELYQNINIRPKYVKETQIMTFPKFHEIIG